MMQPLFHTRPLPLAALGMLFGVLAAANWDARLSGALALAALVMMLPAALMSRRGLMLFFSLLALSVLITRLQTLPAPPEGAHHIEGRVADAPLDYGDGTLRLTLDQVSVDGVSLTGRLLLTSAGEAAVGDTLHADAVLGAPPENASAYYAYKRLLGAARADGFVVTGSRPGMRGLAVNLRALLSERINALFPSGGIAAGILLGDTSGVDEARLADYRDSGAAHLLAVSGLHVAILSGAWMLLFRRRDWLRIVMTLLFLAFYCVITAFSPSVLRASVMMLCFMLARPFRAAADGISNLSLAFLVILLVNPYALFYAGFQLSFIAVYGLITLAPLLRDRLPAPHSTLSQLLGGSLAVWLAMLPAAARQFERVPLVSVPAGLMLIPLAPFFLIPAFLVTALSFVSLPLANALAFPPRWVLTAMDFVAGLGGPVLSLSAPGAASLLLYLAALLFFSRFCLRTRTRRALYGGLCLSASVVLWLL